MFTPILTFEYDEIAHNFVSIAEDLDEVIYTDEEIPAFEFNLDQEADFLSFTTLVVNDLSYIIEEIAPDNVNFV